MRPFEIGGLVQFNHDCGMTWLKIKFVSTYCIEAMTIDLSFSNPPTLIKFDVDDERALTIRKPRKGGKEARDICAMLGRELHRELRCEYAEFKQFGDSMIKEYWIIRKQGKLCKAYRRRLKSAKSMLVQS
jgi:hypothetical protein